MAFRYILRYYIDPGFHEEDRIAELIKFCRHAKIAEVMLFFNAEELNTGHFTMSELERWLPTAKRIKAALTANRIDLSINPWTTTVHTPRGRRLKSGQEDYALMEGMNGRNDGITACPLGEKWLDDLCALWARVAAELQPVAIWIEDDFRYHNHGPELGKGGCYCQLHLAEFSRRVGHKVSREELLKKVFAPGVPHPWRRIWLEVCGDAFLHAAERLSAAVTAASATTRMGLMASYSDTASEEGREWCRLQAVLTANSRNTLAYRPTLAPYTEVWTMRKNPVNARMTISFLKRPLDIYPELESAPRHGAYSLGCGNTIWQILEAASFGSAGITMNLFDMMGCGIAMDRRIAGYLQAAKPRLDAIANLKLDDHNAIGAKILIRQDIAKFSQSVDGALQNRSQEWGRIASCLGFSVQFTSEIIPSKIPYLVNFRTLDAFSDEEVRMLLAQRLILDGEAAESLIHRGFAEYIGANHAVTHATEELDYSYEEILEDDAAVYGLSRPRLTAQRAVMTITEFNTTPAAQMLSIIHGSDHRELFPGAWKYHNALGGDVVVLAYTIGDAPGEEWFYFGWFSPFRRIFIHKVLQNLATDATILYAEKEPFRCYCTALADGGYFIAALNATSDNYADGATLVLTTPPLYSSILRLNSNCEWQTDDAITTAYQRDGQLVIYIPGNIPMHDGIFLKLLPEK